MENDSIKPLSNKHVIISIGGSISSYRVPDIIRELKKNGARVTAILSEAAGKIIGEQAIEWATEEKVITNLTGRMEHISLIKDCDYDHILLMCPATYNQIGKMASGVADGVGETFFANAIGSGVKIFIAPTMHMEMYKNPILESNIKKLETMGVNIIEPRIEEGKAKIPFPEDIVWGISRGKPNGKKVLIISGKSENDIDDVRTITNKSSGITGLNIAHEAYMRGYEVTLIGNAEVQIPKSIKFIPALKIDEFYTNALREIENTPDYIFLPAALSDFKIEKKKGKIKSNEALNLKAEPREKLRDLLKSVIAEKNIKCKLVEWKLSDGTDKVTSGIVVRNMLSNNPFGENGTYYEIYSMGNKLFSGNLDKRKLAFKIFSLLEKGSI
ncbi:bifunctional phosphopantothenoylcysteine decarboxylase/phosphopantothenate--cysteine ligase CoaBC [Caldiplasma sukawensis]